MKKIFMVLSLLLASYGFSASFNWEAFDDSITEAHMGGTAYLVTTATAGGTLDVAKMFAGFSALTAIPGTIDPNYAQADVSSVTNDYGVGVVGENTKSGLKAGNQYAVVIVKGNDFLISSALTATGLSPDGDGSLYFDSSITDGVIWQSGTLASGGGDKPVVPEPTVLALLALGVAGMALRRRA